MYNRPLRIVIADDDATTRMVLRLLLTEHGFTVVGEAGDGERALELCASAKPDLAFLDIDMPKLNGKDAAQKIRQTDPGIAIIIVSALSTLDNVRDAMQAGAGAFVVKPFTTAKLVGAIDSCMKTHKNTSHG